MQEVSLLVASLKSARRFEDAALVVLRLMLQTVDQTLGASPYARLGTVLRGVLHLRPDDSYHQLLALEHGAPKLHFAGAQGAAWLLSSVTAWRSVVEHQGPVTVDVTQGLVQPMEGPQLQSRPPLAFGSQDSQQRFLGRQATHVCVLPLRIPGRGICGMLTLEADCMAAIGQEFIWPECTAALQLLADVAAPYLGVLPAQPAAPSAPDALLPVVGTSMAALLPMLRTFAEQDETILISGPTGAGKSRMARWCHAQSSRRNKPFETLDLATIPEELQMASLFGWKRGAFTGALKDSSGSVALAEGGTFFIDEIDKLSLKAQAGLLYLLEARKYRVLGDSGGEKHADVRFIIGTNVDLRDAVRAGRFREDLYYRINVLPIRIPALDARKDEIPLWADYMVNRRHKERFPDGRARLSPQADQLLLATSWPGNLRQLDNIIRRAYTLALVTQRGDSEVLLSHQGIQQALLYEELAGSHSVVDAFLAAANAFVHEAQRRGEVLELDLAASLQGFILGTAAYQFGREEAFRMVGRENLVKGRNHSKVLRRELEKVEGFCKMLGYGAQSPFSSLLKSEGDGET